MRYHVRLLRRVLEKAHLHSQHTTSRIFCVSLKTF